MSLQAKPPKVLYKYFPPERSANVLVERMLRFTPPSVLNDPFDVHPFVSMGGAEPVRALIERGRQDMRQSFGKAGLGANRMLGDESKEEDRVSFLAHAVDQKLLAMQASLRDTLSREIGLLCLSEVPDSTLMWSHYAKNHTGFAVGFDTLASFFDVHEESFMFGRVQYSRTRPGFSSDTEVEDQPFFVKAADWEYEKEWRVVRRLAHATCCDVEGHNAAHLFEFPKDTITHVILGCNMPYDDRGRIARLLKSMTEDLGPVSVFHAEPDAQTFALNLIEDAEYRRVKFVHV